MPKKRFEIDTTSEIGSIFINDNGEHMSWRECCDLLNDLYGENINLETKVDFLEAHNKALLHTNRELHNKLREYDELLEKVFGYYEIDEEIGLLFDDREYPLISVYNLEDKMNLLLSLLVELNVSTIVDDYDDEWRESRYGELIGLAEHLGCDMKYCKREHDYDKKQYEKYKEEGLK